MRFFAALAFFLALAPPNPSTVTLYNGAKSARVAAADNGAILSIADVVAGLGGSTQPLPGSSISAEINGHRIVAADGVATVASDDRVIVLTRPTRRFGDVLYAPWEFFEKTVLPAAGVTADYDRPGRKIIVHPEKTSAAVPVDVTILHVNQVTQVVFREGAPVAAHATTAPGACTIRFGSAVAPAFGEKAFEDPFVSGVKFSGDAAIIAFREPGLAANAYSLTNPSRYVVEISAAPSPSATGGTTPSTAAAPPAPVVRTVVIDPGHGGGETGAIGPGGLMEKTVTLAIARRLSEILAKTPGVRPVLTRTTDTLVALDERAAIANHEKAALFISIHANSSRAPGAHGSETYYLSLQGSDKLSDALARTENSEGAAPGPAASPGNSSPDLDFILWDMAQSAHLNESAELAEDIQGEMNKLLDTGNRGIKQAPFRVLVGATMPAVLVETAFISNPQEAGELAAPAFQQKAAEAIARGIEVYLAKHLSAPPHP